jgi:hypothetical protein
MLEIMGGCGQARLFLVPCIAGMSNDLGASWHSTPATLVCFKQKCASVSQVLHAFAVALAKPVAPSLMHKS